MIFYESSVKRYAFVFNTKAKPFSDDDCPSKNSLTQWKLLNNAALPPRLINFIEPFRPMVEWLTEQTFAFRVSAVSMWDKNSGYVVTGIMLQMPENLAPIFRLFWYD